MEDLLATWALDASSSDPGEPPLPSKARYRISRAGDGLQGELTLVDPHGRTLRSTFALAGDELASHTLEDGGATLVVVQDGRRVVYRRLLDDVKQVILYRRDLAMRKGKIAAQVAHASLAVFLRRDEGAWGHLSIPLDAAMASWVARGTAKVVLSVETEADLLRAYEEARARGLPAEVVTDAGRTEFHGVPTRTTCAIGPARAADIDAITGPEGLVATKLA